MAAKASLASRVDALGEDVSGNTDLGIEIRAKIEQHLKALEEGNLRRVSGTAKAKAKFEKYHGKRYNHYLLLLLSLGHPLKYRYP